MINKTQQKKLSKLLNGSYTQEVLRILNKKNLVNKRGNRYNAMNVRHVFTGYRNNIDIESAIYEVAKLRKEAKEARKEILK